jgi:hypothetical protein
LTAEQSWEIPWRRAEIPAAGGHGNARSVALAQSVVSAGGSARGVDLLTTEVIDRIFDVQAAGARPRARDRRHVRRRVRVELAEEPDQPRIRASATGVDGAARSSSTTSTPG